MFDNPHDKSTLPQTTRGAFERLQGDYGGADKQSKRAKFNLVLGDIHLAPEVFQHRDQSPEYQWERSFHIADLLGAIGCEPSRRLDRITVWCCGGRWIVLDGHYRLEAYIQYAREQGVPLNKFAVPCEAFKGDPYEAWDYAATANRKVTSPLTTTERSNAAWKRVCLSWKDGKWLISKANLAALGLVKSSTIGRMRSTLIELLNLGLLEGKDPMELTWLEADQLFKGGPSSDREFDYMDDVDPMTQDWADRLTRTFGKAAWKNPLVFLFALERYSPKMVADITDYLNSPREDF